jgi:hypothetical protein
MRNHVRKKKTIERNKFSLSILIKAKCKKIVFAMGFTIGFTIGLLLFFTMVFTMVFAIAIYFYDQY